MASEGCSAVLSAGMTMAAVFAFPSPAVAQVPSGDGDDQVSGRPYVRHDGGTDAGIPHCNDGRSPDYAE